VLQRWTTEQDFSSIFRVDLMTAIDFSATQLAANAPFKPLAGSDLPTNDSRKRAR
jgi:hypothetical protein